MERGQPQNMLSEQEIEDEDEAKVWNRTEKKDEHIYINILKAEQQEWG